MAPMHQNAATQQCSKRAKLPPPRTVQLCVEHDLPHDEARRSARTLFSGQTLLAMFSPHVPLDPLAAYPRGGSGVDTAADDPILPDMAALRRRFRLTEREAEVARLLAQRRTNKEIARVLDVSWHTARRHTERVLGKLGIRSRRHVLAAINRPVRTDIVWSFGVR